MADSDLEEATDPIEDAYDDGSDAGAEPMDSRASSNGLGVPAAVLVQALAGDLESFLARIGISVVLIVPKPSWANAIVSAARALARWNTVLEGDLSPKSRAVIERSAIEQLSRGGRVLCVVPSKGEVPGPILASADIVLTIERVDRAAIVRAVELATKVKPRGLSPEIGGVDLVQAMGAIRNGTSAASCVRRLNALVDLRSTAASFPESLPTIADLRGYGEAKPWAERLMLDIERYRRGELAFSEIQRAVVLAGPPGVGKTTLVQSLAKSSGMPLIATSVASWFNGSSGYLDGVIKAATNDFASARAKSPSILLLDEIEALPSRGALEDRHASWWTPVVNHVLTLLDSAVSSASDGLVLIGATNYPERLDPALVRPGRMERIIHIGLPEEGDLEAIFRQHLGNALKDEDVAGAAALAVGATGAMVKYWVKGAVGRARQSGRAVVLQDLIEQICPPSVLSRDEKRRVAVHELGHAVVAWVVGRGEVLNIMLSGYDGTGGLVTYRTEEKVLDDRASLRRLVVRLLGGRAAEDVVIGSPSSGAGGGSASDLAKATALLAASRLSLGLDGTLFHYADPELAMLVARQHPTVIHDIELELEGLYARACEIVREHAGFLNSAAETLVRRQVITGQAFASMMSDAGIRRGDRDA